MPPIKARQVCQPELTTTGSDFALDCFTKELLWTKRTFQQVYFMEEKGEKLEMTLLSATIIPFLSLRTIQKLMELRVLLHPPCE